MGKFNFAWKVTPLSALMENSNMTSFFRFASKRAINPMTKSHYHMRGTRLNHVIKSQNKIIYTFVNVLNIYIKKFYASVSELFMV
jgi:hypothetical protein